MALHEDTLREQYTTHLAAFHTAFSNVEPPTADWWRLWIDKYPFEDIQTAIQTLSGHPLKARFTQESTGKAIAAKLREIAMRRAISDAPKVGGRS